MPDTQEEPADLAEERCLEGMRIVRTGRGCYLAYSQSRTETAYAIDLAAHQGLGSCFCEDFLYRRYPRWKEVRRPFDAFRCRHIRKIRNHVLDQIIAYYQGKQQ